MWSNGPLFKSARVEHVCGYHHKSNSIIAAGGRFGSPVEVLRLDDVDPQWQYGPELPQGINLAAMVEYPEDDSLILIGGYGYHSHAVLSNIYKLRDTDADATWEKMTQELKIARHYHVAFLIPDEFTNCSYSNISNYT